jgi:acetyl-CoA synthetase
VARDRRAGQPAPRRAGPRQRAPLFSLYTSGTTGKPKGILHTTGGYQVGAYYSSKLVFDLRDDDIFWCTADIGWVTGHSYVVYGPLMNGATVMLYEGAPNQPAPDRFWDVIERWGVTVFYTAPTAIRAFMRWGDEYPARHDLSSLRLLGSVGEPINPEAWMWYRRTIGGDRCPIVDTWWQTETGVDHDLAACPARPRPSPARRPAAARHRGRRRRQARHVSVGANQGGFLVIKRPWPSMLRTIFGDHPRFEKTYFGEIPGVYFAGDGARRDDDGYFWIMGRVDDVINVAGHRLSTMEVESALVSHPKVAEAAVVGRPDELKGQAIVAFVTPRAGISPTRRWPRSCAATSPIRSARWRGPRRSASPTRCPRPAPARSCAACCARSPAAPPPAATPPRSKIKPSSSASPRATPGMSELFFWRGLSPDLSSPGSRPRRASSPRRVPPVRCGAA